MMIEHQEAEILAWEVNLNPNPNMKIDLNVQCTCLCWRQGIKIDELTYTPLRPVPRIHHYKVGLGGNGALTKIQSQILGQPRA